MALSLVGNTGRGQIWVGLSSVMSKEAPIPPAPSCEAAQPNHGHPTRHLKAIFSVQVLTHNEEDKTHSGRMETKQKTYSCSQCGYKSTRSGNLKTHQQIHTGDKPFSCSKCDYKCAQLGNLKNHERTHNGDKPFSCSLCDKSFTQKVFEEP